MIASRVVTAATLATLALAAPASAELTLPRPSPKSSVTQTIGVTDFTVTYSRPGVKGRTIWGDLVPYDKPWRTGANEATTFTCSDEVTFGGQKLPAGTYSLFTIPTTGDWTVILNKEKDLWGAYQHKPEQDLLKVQVKPQPAEHQEWMSLGFENLSTTGGELVLRWEKLRVPVKVEVEVNDKALASCRTEIAAAKPDDWRTAMRCARFSHDAGINLEAATAWLEKSIAMQENYYNVTLKAEMAAKAGKTKEAVTLAEKAVKLGKASKEPVDTVPTERLIAQWTTTKK